MSNYFEIVENAFREILASGLSPFVKREMIARYGANWVTSGKVSVQSFHLNKGDLNWSDMQAVLKLMIDQWNNVFQQKLGSSNRSLVFELREARNKLKHEDRESFDFSYSFRTLHNIELLLSAIPNDPLAKEKSHEAAIKHEKLLAVIVEAQSKKDKSLFSWHDICGVMLLQKQRDSLRRKATEIGAEVNVYVSLDLLHREERSRNDSLRNEREDKKPVSEIEKTYKHDDFLESLTERQSKNKHIAIAGEAGAGKTTLLARIAEELHKQGQLTIFISLADLQDKSLDDYIYEFWLASALGKRKGSAPEAQKDDLFEQFKAGKIWLLLDGLDEMQSKSSADALYRIEREIKGVIEQSRVILTCRLNVWDTHLNGLSNFDTFRMGSFSPEQVDEFISDWFVSAECHQNAIILQAKLKEVNRDRIRDMVRHPLRLALLCQAFYRNPDTELPETKAGLYELFVRYFYEWKPNIVDIDLNDSLKDELHQALGKLAIAGIDGDEGFRLSSSLAVKEMGDLLFRLACNLGWINLVDRNEKEQEVYSFFHATFQEYFAALAIDDHSYLFNQSKNLSQGNYRVFLAKWKEVFLLWLGRNEDSLLSEKRALMSDLLNFQDDCGGFYTDRAFLLVAEGTSEFDDFDEIYNVIKRVVREVFDCVNIPRDEGYFGNIPSSELKELLYKTEPNWTAAEIVDLHDDFINEYSSITNPDDGNWKKLVNKVFWAAETIGNIYPQDPWVVERLVAYLGFKVYDQSFLIAYQKHCVGVAEAIDALQKEVLKWEKELNFRKEDFENKTSLKYIEDSVKISILLKDLEKTLVAIDPLHQDNGRRFDIEIDNLVSELRKITYQITKSDYILNTNFHDISITMEIVMNIIESCFNHYYSSSEYYGLNVNGKLFGTRNSYIECNNYSKLNSIKSILKNHSDSELFLIDIINHREQGYIFAIEFINDLVSDKNINLIEITLVGVIDDTSLESGIRVYAAIVLKKICPSHIKSLFLLSDFCNIDIEYASSAMNSLRETDFSMLSYEEKSFLKERLLNNLNNKEIVDRSFEFGWITCTPISSSSIHIVIDRIDSLPLVTKQILPVAKEILFNHFNFEGWYKGICHDLASIGVSKSEIFEKLLPFLDNVWIICEAHELNHQVSRQSILFTLEKLALDRSKILPIFIREYLLVRRNGEVYDDWALIHMREFLLNITKDTNYVEFNKIWQSYCGNPSNISSLNTQFIDCQYIQQELTKHPEIRCLVVDIRELAEVSDPNVIAQKIANRIFDSLGMEIPELHNIAVLETVLLNLKRIIGVKKLAIALYGAGDNKAIDQLIQNLATSSIEIRSFREGQSTEQIITQINAWLSEINH